MKGSDCIKSKVNRLFILGLFFAFIMSISGIFAINNSLENGTIVTGIVDIKLENYKINSENQQVEYGEDTTIVTPGDNISFIPKVYNAGESCYLRVKFFYVDDNTNIENYVTNFSNKLEKHGEYYYYKEQFQPKETITIFDTISIPPSITNTENGGTIVLKITAEAIQYKNFEPDYTLADPWKNITPTKSTSASYDINPNNINNTIVIKYENETEKDITVPDSIFKDVKIVMPGDSFNEKIQLKNNGNKTKKYFVNLDYTKTERMDQNLLNNIDLIIKNKSGNTIYTGKIINAGKVLLGEYDPNNQDEFTFYISVPSELDNKYELLNPELVWIFSTEYDEEGEQQQEEPDDTQGNKQEKGQPKTGDQIDLAFTIFFISSIGLVITIILSYIEKRKNID